MTINYDIHTHSLSSGHGSNDKIADMAKKAADIGLSVLGISDHGPKTPGGASESYFRSLKLAPERRCGITVLYGAEANIIDYDGNLDLSNEVLKDLDYCIVSLHTKSIKPGTMEENTNAYLKAMDNPYVRVIGHPDDGNFPVCYERLVKKAKEKGIVIELNNTSLCDSSYRPNARENCKKLLEMCQKYSLPIIFSSDSHGAANIGNFTDCYKFVEENNFPEDLIIQDLNTFLR